MWGWCIDVPLPGIALYYILPAVYVGGGVLPAAGNLLHFRFVV